MSVDRPCECHSQKCHRQENFALEVAIALLSLIRTAVDARRKPPVQQHIAVPLNSNHFLESIGWPENYQQKPIFIEFRFFFFFAFFSSNFCDYFWAILASIADIAISEIQLFDLIVFFLFFLNFF